MYINDLRAKHPRFIYQSYEINEVAEAYIIRFHFLLEPDIHFAPEIVIPALEPGSIDTNRPFFKLLIFNLGMIETLSYWKAACPPELVVEAGSLTEEQAAWWHDLFINGLGEFFYKNQIDFTHPDFLTITTSSSVVRSCDPAILPSPLHGNLIMVGGGKDSAVTLELLRQTKSTNNVLLLNPTPAALAVTGRAGYDHPIIVKRTIDPTLTDLNNQGYLNGHTPFSAYLAFLGILMASVHGYRNVIASNEASASEGSLEYLGHSINHQYSKSFAFEKKFRGYLTRLYLAMQGTTLRKPEYFSLIRPLSELQVAALFAHMPQYHHTFVSCNVNRGNGWCGACAKCAFVYLALSPFLTSAQMKTVFGSDFFEKKELRQHFLDLAGAGKYKPFDCVGTPEETRNAIGLTINNYTQQNIALPTLLIELKNTLNIPDSIDSQAIYEKLKTSWNPSHFLPAEYEAILKSAIHTIT